MQKVACIMLQAEPEPLEIDLQRTALMVLDVQNAFISKGGMFDLLGIDLAPHQKIIDPIKKLIGAARSSGVKVIYTVHQYSPDLRESGGPNSPAWYKVPTVKRIREHPEWRDKLLVRGVWGADIVEELKPQEDEIVVEKQRYSAFYQTNLDSILKTYDIKYLLFVGEAINICVEASIRDAFYIGYFPIVIPDACGYAGPPFTKDATIFNVKLLHGWVTTSGDVIKALQRSKKNERKAT